MGLIQRELSRLRRDELRDRFRWRWSRSVGVIERDGDGIRSVASMGLPISRSSLVWAKALLNSGRAASLLSTDPFGWCRLTTFGVICLAGAFGGSGGRGAADDSLIAAVESLAAETGGRGGSALPRTSFGLFGWIGGNFFGFTVGLSATASFGPSLTPITFDSECGMFVKTDTS